MMSLEASNPPHVGGGEEEESLSSKKIVDRYLKGEILGEGTYGVVFKAIDTEVKYQLLSF